MGDSLFCGFPRRALHPAGFVAGKALVHSCSMRMMSPAMTRRMNTANSALIIVAHPDDEVLWAGGTILARPTWDWHVVAMCRASDPDRSPRFRRVLEQLGADGGIADLDDGPEQIPLEPEQLEHALLSLVPDRLFDVLLTHGPKGEYTRHRRHEEVCWTVTKSWHAGDIRARELWLFSFEDGSRAYLPRADATAAIQEPISAENWRTKFRLMTQSYGFGADSWEARTTPRVEAFRSFQDSREALNWVIEQQSELDA